MKSNKDKTVGKAPKKGAKKEKEKLSKTIIQFRKMIGIGEILDMRAVLK